MSKVQSIEDVVDTSNDATLTSLLLTVKQVAILLSVSQRTIWRLVSLGELPAPVSLGRAKRWPRKDIEGYVAGKSDNVSMN